MIRAAEASMEVSEVQNAKACCPTDARLTGSVTV
jgi:hypothetical protein